MLMVHRERLVHPELQVLMVHQEHQEHLVLMVHRERLVHPELQVLMVHQEHQEHLVLMVHRGHQVLQVLMVRQELLEPQVRQELQELVSTRYRIRQTIGYLHRMVLQMLPLLRQI